jgi:dephospho-CoA kinase
MERDKSTEEDASARLNSQLAIAEKLVYADEVIYNSGTLQELEAQVNKFVEKVDKSVSWWWLFSWLCPPFGVVSAMTMLSWRWIWSSSRQRRIRKANQTK